MRAHRWLVGFLALALLTGACGNDGAKTDSQDVYAAAELDAAMLTTDDLGKGWTEQIHEVFTTRGEEGPPALNSSALCPAAGAQVEQMKALAADSGVVVELREGGLARHDFHGVTEQVWSNDDVSRYFAVFETALGACVGTTWTVEDSEAEGAEDDGQVTLSAAQAPTIGDESTAAVAESVTPGPDGNYVWRSRMLVARFGKVLMTLDELDVQIEGSQPHFTPAAWADVAESAAEAVDRLE